MSMQDYKRAQKFGRQRQAAARAAGQDGPKPSIDSVFGDAGDGPKSTQGGGVDDLPFASRDGMPKGQAPEGEPFDMTEENRPQPAAMPVPIHVPNDISAMSRAQLEGSYAQRLAPQSMPKDGSKPDSLPIMTRFGGCGSVGDNSKPFRIKG
jgi:hypothetical protein